MSDIQLNWSYRVRLTCTKCVQSLRTQSVGVGGCCLYANIPHLLGLVIKGNFSSTKCWPFEVSLVRFHILGLYYGFCCWLLVYICTQPPCWWLTYGQVLYVCSSRPIPFLKYRGPLTNYESSCTMYTNARKRETETYRQTYLQWAAVIIQLLLTTLHPQLWLFLYWKLHCQGHEWGIDSWPPMMRPSPLMRIGWSCNVGRFPHGTEGDGTATIYNNIITLNYSAFILHTKYDWLLSPRYVLLNT